MAKPNLLAKFIVSREFPTAHPNYKAMNVWPENLPGFRETVLEYHEAIEKLGRSFLPIWATSLNLPATFFDKILRKPASVAIVAQLSATA